MNGVGARVGTRAGARATSRARGMRVWWVITSQPARREHGRATMKRDRTETDGPRAGTAAPALVCQCAPTRHGLRFPREAHDETAAWRVFRSSGPQSHPKEAAYDDAKARAPRGAFGGPLPIISWQKNTAGTREYTVTSWPAFWTRYERIPPPRRRFFELIRTDCPCKLFFDIEDGFAPHDETALATLRARTAELAAWVSAQLAAQPAWAAAVHNVVWLDASDPARGKFSVHLVWNLRPADATFTEEEEERRLPADTLLFKSSADVQALVEWLHARAIAERVACWWLPSHVPDATAVARTSLTRKAAMIDFGVHTHGDREFRLLHSAKPPKADTQARPLRWVEFAGGPAPPTADAFADGGRRLASATFYASLVTYVPASCVVRGILKAQFADASRVSSSGRLLGLPGEAAGGTAGRLRAGARTSRASHLPARLQKLLEYVRLSMEDACPDAATLRLERYYDDLWCTVFRSTNRYCELQGCEHKSNGVYYVCWLGTGRFYQRCLDPDCAEEYRADLAAEVRERALAYASVKDQWTPDERAAEEAYLEDRRALAGNAELRARGEIYTLQPELRVPGASAPIPLWALLTAYRRQAEAAADDSESEADAGSDAEPPRKKLCLSFAVDSDAAEEEDAPGEDLGTAFDRALSQDVEDGLDALFA